MKLAILSLDPGLYSTRRLVEVAEHRGHVARVLDYLECRMDIKSHRPRVLLGGRRLTRYDCVVPRIGASNTFYGCAVVRQFEMMDVFSACSSDAIARSRDKLRSMQLLAKAGVGLPTTAFAHSSDDVEGLLRVVGGAPVVIKLLVGTQGKGVVLAETEKSAESMIQAFRGNGTNILVQEYIKEAGGADIRCFVVGGKVVASMKRQGPPGEFRSNLHRGGFAKPIRITKEERITAIMSAKVMGLGIAGVDMLRSNHGPVVMEVNSSPGLEGIEQTTGVDVASKIIMYLEKSVKKLKRTSKIKKSS